MSLSHIAKSWTLSGTSLNVIVALVLLAPIVFESGCGGSNPVTPPLALNEMQATSSGEGDFLANDAVADSSSGLYVVRATMSVGQVGSLVIELSVPKQTALPYLVDVASNSNAQISYCVNPNGTGCNQFDAESSIGSGQITVTQVSPTFMGSFQGTLWQIPNSGTDTVRILNDGQFNAPWQ
jgi:hypothetical protein